MSKSIIFVCALALAAPLSAQETWTVEDCMRYAVEHSHDVRRQELALDNNRAERTAAIGAFLPAISAGTSAQENFGRAIDPETNTYTDVSTFYQGLSASATLPLFDGLQRWHRLQASRVGILLGKTQLEIRKDEVALAVFQAYTDALYYRGTTQLAEEKLAQSRAQLHRTEVMAEVGQKSEADVAQMRATVAADEVERTRQENLYQAAMLSLKRAMGYPSPALPHGGGSFEVTFEGLTNCRSEGTSSKTNYSSPSPVGEGWEGVLAARLNVSLAERQLKQARSNFYPSLSLSAGYSTTYFKTVGNTATPYSRQLRDNAGQYVYASLSIPVFSRLQNIANLRRQKNNLAIAREDLAAKTDELTAQRLQAEMDCESLRREVEGMERKVEADSLAQTLTQRQYEEGLASPLDLQTFSVTLLQSRASLLRARLMWALKCKCRDYYEGKKPYPHPLPMMGGE